MPTETYTIQEGDMQSIDSVSNNDQLQIGDYPDVPPADKILSHDDAQTKAASHTLSDDQRQQYIATIAQLESQLDQREEQPASTSAQINSLQTVISQHNQSDPWGMSIDVEGASDATHEDLISNADFFSAGFDDYFFSASFSPAKNQNNTTPAIRIERRTDPQATTCHPVLEEIQIQTSDRMYDTSLSLDISETGKSRKSKRSLPTGSLVPTRLGRFKAKAKPNPRAEFDNVESIEAFLTDEVEMKNEMTKTAFRKLLLDQGGIHAEDALIDAIFDQTDKDGNGLLDARELATYIHDIKPSTKNQRRKYILLSCLTYPPFYLTFLCLNASLMSATTNIREREYGDLYGKKHPYWAIASVSDLIGLFGYVILKWEEERLKYENLVQAKTRLVRWINFDLPRYSKTTAERKLRESMLFSTSSNVGNGEPDIERGEGSLPSTHRESCAAAKESYGLDMRRTQVSFVDDFEENVVAGITVKEEAKPKHLAGGAQLLKATGEVIKATGEVIKATGEVIKATGEPLTEALKAGIGGLGKVEFGEAEATSAIRAFLFGEKEGATIDDGHQGLDLQELQLLLESMGVFLADHALQEIFAEIDVDVSGSITIDELLIYARTNQKILSSNSRLRKYCGILTRCFKTIGWYSSWSYLAGASFWVCLSTIKGASFQELKSFLGLTCIFYLIGALGNLSNLYSSTQSQLWQIDNARMMLRGAAISVGLVQIAKEARESSTIEDRKKDKGRLPTLVDEVEDIQTDIRDEAIAKLEQTDEMNARQAILAVRSNVKTMASDISGSSSGVSWQAHDAETIALAQKRGASFLFQLIDVSNDGNIDEKEFYHALVTLGVLIPSHSFSALYKSVDTDRDSSLQLTEFTEYVANIEPGLSKRRRSLTTVSFMFTQISLYLIFVQVFAGFVQTYAALIGLATVNRTKNLFVCGSFGWAVGSLYFFFVWPKNKGRFFNSVETAKFMMKSSILEGVEMHFNAPSTKYLGNMRNGLR